MLQDALHLRRHWVAGQFPAAAIGKKQHQSQVAGRGNQAEATNFRQLLIDPNLQAHHRLIACGHRLQDLLSTQSALSHQSVSECRPVAYAYAQKAGITGTQTYRWATVHPHPRPIGSLCAVGLEDRDQRPSIGIQRRQIKVFKDWFCRRLGGLRLRSPRATRSERECGASNESHNPSHLLSLVR